MVLALILLVLLGCSALLNFSHLIGSLASVGNERSSGLRLEEITLEDNSAKDKIAVIRVDGVIASGAENGYDMVEVIKEQLQRADEDKHVKAVVLKV